MSNVLRVIAIAIAIGAAPAGAAGQVHKPGAAAQPVLQPGGYVAASFALPYSFADILNIPIAADAPAFTGVAMSRSAQGAETGGAPAGGLPMALYSDVDVAESTPPATLSSNGSRMDFWRAHAPGAFTARAPGAAGREQGNGYLVSTAAAPGPSGGAMLLCGVTVLVFMARRKIQPVAG